MSRFFGKYLIFSVILLAVPLPDHSGPQAADDTLYMLNFEDAAVSPRGRVIMLSEQLKRLVRQCIPSRGEKSSVREIFAVLSDGKTSRPFTFRTDKYNNLRCYLPDSYPKLMNEPAALPRLTGAFLFGRAGKDPALEKHFRNSWFIVGLSRKLLDDMNPLPTPFSGYFPAAYALTSAGIYPSLHRLLETPLLPDDTTPRLIYEEYCQLLVTICLRNGLFREGLLARMLDELENNPNAGMPEMFCRLAFPLLKKKRPSLFPAGTVLPDQSEIVEKWFRQELDALLNGTFLPPGVEKMESRYLEAVRFSAELKPADRDQAAPPVRIEGGLRELVQDYDRLKEPEKTANGIVFNLTRLLRQSPGSMKIPLERVRSALQEYIRTPKPAAAARLLEAERQIFPALEKELLLERFLTETDRDCVAPAARYYLTFHLIDYQRNAGEQPLPQLARLLEQTEKESKE